MTDNDTLREVLVSLAPGTQLRDGLERIIRGRGGALIVMGYGPDVQALCSDGFEMDVKFSPQRLRELCKMDGAVLLSEPDWRIRRANVQLLPDPSIPTLESGMRHRTAHRMAVETGVPVISVSHSLQTIALYFGSQRYVLEDSRVLLGRADQALSTLEKYKSRLEEITATLSALEIEDFVTLRDVALVVQRMEMVRRISFEIEGYVTELGTDGRLLSMQLDELIRGTARERTRLLRDYAPRGASLTEMEDAIQALSATDIMDLSLLGRILQPGLHGVEGLDLGLHPHGYRMLAKIPRLPFAVVEALVIHFGEFQALLRASSEDLQEVEGVGPQRANIIHDGLQTVAANASLLSTFS
ncbi:MAG: DNA integrity scanning diadenylate cyclase DisA [Actinomycetaceae bacterium]|nr:DNA integrity scanning diadenylate cyclase DisA [Actinomycetaceae bacterium]